MRPNSLWMMLTVAVTALVATACAKAIAPPTDSAPVVSEFTEPTDAETLMIALDFCEQVHESVAADTTDPRALEAAAVERGQCIHEAADTSLAFINGQDVGETLEFAQDIVLALDTYRATYGDLCDFTVLASDTPYGPGAELAKARCRGDVELQAAHLVAAWGFKVEGERGVQLDVPKRHTECYVAYNRRMTTANTQLDLQSAQLNLWACIADLATAKRVEVIEAARRNVNGFDARYLEEDFDMVLDATTKSNSEVCGLFVDLGQDPKSAWTALDRATCGTDAESLRDGFFDTALPAR